MVLPKYAYISIHATVDIDNFLNSEDREYLERNGFKDEDLKNKLEEWIRDNIWECVPENKIHIEID